jgi:hypothetical protein
VESFHQALNVFGGNRYEIRIGTTLRPFARVQKSCPACQLTQICKVFPSNHVEGRRARRISGRELSGLQLRIDRLQLMENFSPGRHANYPVAINSPVGYKLDLSLVRKSGCGAKNCR